MCTVSAPADVQANSEMPHCRGAAIAISGNVSGVHIENNKSRDTQYFIVNNSPLSDSSITDNVADLNNNCADNEYKAGGALVGHVQVTSETLQY